MRGVAAYLLAGILVVLAMDIVAPPVGLGVSAGALPGVERAAPLHVVDRTNKSDRLRAPTADGKMKPVPQKAPTLMVGCEPPVSPLSGSGRATAAGRCIAGLTDKSSARG